jgi:hypothetical protein
VFTCAPSGVTMQYRTGGQLLWTVLQVVVCYSLRTSPVVFANTANCVGQPLANTYVCEQFVCADCRQTDVANRSSPGRVRQLLANSVQTVSVSDWAVQDADEADGINFGRLGRSIRSSSPSAGVVSGTAKSTERVDRVLQPMTRRGRPSARMS